MSSTEPMPSTILLSAGGPSAGRVGLRVAGAGPNRGSGCGAGRILAGLRRRAVIAGTQRLGDLAEGLALG
ncbi:hypothetical protein, partial [Methylobrevis pamukkalensis]|uniref:hypothetical protein n=1 Tax=Methylobrevis pamukkalensis TaxID=1439726 RepID=UPI001FD980E6